MVADRERDRLSRTGPELLGHLPAPTGLREAVADRAVRRELLWTAVHGSVGLVIGVFAISLPINVLRDGSFPLWWSFVPPSEATPSLGLWTVTDWPGAFAVSLLGIGWFAVTLAVAPGMARLQAWPGRRLLAPPPGTDLSLRVAELTATRAAALDAHATELRRIERSLHDGTQNRLVAVDGAARRGPPGGGPRPGRAPTTSSNAPRTPPSRRSAELRAVVARHPAAGAGRPGPRRRARRARRRAARCPAGSTSDVPGRCAASVEATAYFVVAEALTNIAKHSGAGTRDRHRAPPRRPAAG